MGQDVSGKESATSLTLPGNEIVPRTSDRYHLFGVRMDDGFDFGVSVPPDGDGTVEKFPQTVYEVIPSMADEALDMDDLRAETTTADWPLLGTLTLSRESGDTVNVTIEWHASLSE